jgi:hypothetical protein
MGVEKGVCCPHRAVVARNTTPDKVYVDVCLTVSRMFEPFSSGYYLGRLYVQARDGERAAVHEDRHEQVTRELYADGEDVEGGVPLVMKLGTTHLPVHGAAGVPDGTLAVPEGWLAATGVENPPSLREVLLAKADRARQLLAMDVPDAGPEGSF